MVVAREVIERFFEDQKDVMALLCREFDPLQIERGGDLTPDALGCEHVSGELPDAQHDLLEISGVRVSQPRHLAHRIIQLVTAPQQSHLSSRGALAARCLFLEAIDRPTALRASAAALDLHKISREIVVNRQFLAQLDLPLAAIVNAALDDPRAQIRVAGMVEVFRRRAPLRTRQPDVLYLSSERSGIKGRAELREMPVIEIAPDLVVEVLSSSDTRRALASKLRDYQTIGVREGWLVSPEAETVEVLRLSTTSATTVKIFGLGDTLRSEVLPAFKLKLTDIFS